MALFKDSNNNAVEEVSSTFFSIMIWIEMEK